MGFEPLYHNANPLAADELGYAKRSSHQENQVPLPTLGALKVEYQDNIVHIGTGFTQAQRQEIWNNKGIYLNKLVKFKYFPVGVKKLPRHPVFLGFRDARD